MDRVVVGERHTVANRGPEGRIGLPDVAARRVPAEPQSLPSDRTFAGTMTSPSSRITAMSLISDDVAARGPSVGISPAGRRSAGESTAIRASASAEKGRPARFEGLAMALHDPAEASERTAAQDPG